MAPIALVGDDDPSLIDLVAISSQSELWSESRAPHRVIEAVT
jgi:hypothetical protein